MIMVLTICASLGATDCREVEHRLEAVTEQACLKMSQTAMASGPFEINGGRVIKDWRCKPVPSKEPVK